MRFRGLQNKVRELAGQIQNEFVWMQSIDFVRPKRRVGKVFQVLRDDYLSPPRMAAASTWRSFSSGRLRPGIRSS